MTDRVEGLNPAHTNLMVTLMNERLAVGGSPGPEHWMGADALGRDVLPAVLLHRFAHRHACGGKLWRTLLAERDAGRIGQLGVSAATPEEAGSAAAISTGSSMVASISNTTSPSARYAHGSPSRP